jgi:hypothetical protein
MSPVRNTSPEVMKKSSTRIKGRTCPRENPVVLQGAQQISHQEGSARFLCCVAADCATSPERKKMWAATSLNTIGTSRMTSLEKPNQRTDLKIAHFKKEEKKALRTMIASGREKAIGGKAGQ